MEPTMRDDELIHLWKKQEHEPMQFSIEELRRDSAAFQQRIGRRNRPEYVGVALVVIAFSWMFLRSHDATPRTGFALIIAGALYVAFTLWKKGSVQPLPGALGQADCISFHRRELERQRDLLMGIWKWYLGPLIPGMAILVIGGIANAPANTRWFSEIYAVFCVAIFAGIGRLNQKAAKKLDGQIQELRTLRKES